MRIPVVIQMQPGENGAAALCMMLGYFKKYLPLSEVREKTIVSRNGANPDQILNAAEEFGLTGGIRKASFEEVCKGKLPLLVQWKKRYYCIIKWIGKDLITVIDPAKGEVTMTVEKFCSVFSGTVIDLAPAEGFRPGGKPVSVWTLMKKRLEGSKSAIVLIILLSLVASIFGVLSLNPTKTFVDEVIKARHGQMYLPLLFAMTLFLVIQTVMAAVKTQLVAKAGRKAAAVSGAALFKKMLSLPMRYFENHSAGDLMQRIESNINISRSLLNSVIPRIVDAGMTLLYIGLLFYYDSRIAAACLGVELLYLLVSGYRQAKIAIVSRSVMTNSGSMDASLLNGLDTIETIKSSGREQSFYELWTESLEQYSES